MEDEITVGGVYVNINNWTFYENSKYKMAKAEADKILPVLARDMKKIAQARADHLYCQECGNEVNATDRFCRYCGQRLGD
jgi:rRNA maturation endonuclease Nob1